MRALAVVALLAAPAQANRWVDAMNHAQGGAWLHYEATGLTAVDDGDPDPHELVLAGARLHGFLGPGPHLAYYIGLDLAAGGTIRGGGFAYDVTLHPIGVMVRFGKTSFAGISTGVAAMGATATLDDAVALPVEAVFEIGRSWRLLGRARASWLGATGGTRQNGSPTFGFTDEVEAMLGLRFGTKYEEEGFPMGDGYFIGASYREMAGTRFVGATIGFSIDVASRRRGRHDDD